MSWFKVDDKFHGHAKVKRLPRAVRAEAIGTWTLAGTWSSDHETDGYVPEYMVDELGGSTAGAEALVEVALWRRRRGGFVFVNWSEWQPTRDEQEQKRAAARERQRKHREKAGNSGEGDEPVTRDKREVRAPRPVPSRPDPRPDDQSIGDLTSEQPDAGPTGDNPVETVDNPPAWADAPHELLRIAEAVTRHPGGRAILHLHPIQVAGIRQHYVERAKTPPRDQTRYTITCLNREDAPVLANYLDTGRWSA